MANPVEIEIEHEELDVELVINWDAVPDFELVRTAAPLGLTAPPAVAQAAQTGGARQVARAEKYSSPRS